ncbi:MAG TPA: hypothetical protein DCM67_04985 [Propionibacteriaceae bacterium]|nr:hypothetical protein [Propionibacteriaceae bacterium]
MGVVFTAVVWIAVGLAALWLSDGERVVVGSVVIGSGAGVDDSEGVGVGVIVGEMHSVGQSVGHVVGQVDGS